MKFLIIQTAFPGDVILATPLIEKLRKFYLSSEIDFLLRKGNEGLLQGHPFIKNLLVWNKSKNKISNLFSLISKIRKNKYDHVINLQRFASSGIITVLSGGKIKSGFDKNPLSFLFDVKKKHEMKAGIHEVDRNLSLIQSITDASFFKPKLYPSSDDFESVKSYKQKGKYICIAPASIWFTKQFPAHKWIELIKNLDENYPIYLIGAASDYELCEKIRLACIPNPQSPIPNPQSLAGKLSFLQSAALMKDASMNYVNDSAPLHIASAMNAAVTAVFCSTIPAFGFGPLSDKSIIWETTEKLSCRPCGIHGFKACPEKHFKCAERIEIINVEL